MARKKKSWYDVREWADGGFYGGRFEKREDRIEFTPLYKAKTYKTRKGAEKSLKRKGLLGRIVYQ